MKKIELTDSQVENLIEFFDLEFIPSLQSQEVDNIDYVVDMCDIYKKLKGGAEE